MTQEALKLALEALEDFGNHDNACPQWPTYSEPEKYPKCNCGYDDAITAIKAALAQPEQEPVAWQFMNGSSFRKRRPDDFSDLASDGLPYWRPLYITPPQRTESVIDKSAAIRIATALGWTPPRTWVGLTNQEQLDIFAQSVAKKRSEYKHYKAIEQALKEKNQ